MLQQFAALMLAVLQRGCRREALPQRGAATVWTWARPRATLSQQRSRSPHQHRVADEGRVPRGKGN